MQTSFAVRLVVVSILVLAVAGIVIFLPVKDYFYRFLDGVQEMGPWGPPLLGATYILAVLLFVPGSLLTMGAGFVFGVAVGTIIVSFASTLGATAAFLLGRTLMRDWVQEKVARNHKFHALDEKVRQQGFKIVLLLRLSPVFPFNLLNYALGLTQVSFRDYVLASWIGMLPGTVMYVYLGSTLKSLSDLVAGNHEGEVAEKIFFGVGLLATASVTVLVTRLARKALKQTVPLPKKEHEARQGEQVHV